MKVALFVTHLLGTGHLARTFVLARALSAEGHTACVVSGGVPAPHLNAQNVGLIQLPSLRSDGVNFTRLLAADGQPASQAVLAERRKQAVDALRAFGPDVVVTELFPFGRRILADEFKAVIEAASRLDPRPLICCSIRDILAPPSKPAKAAATDALVDQFYDAVLVHSAAEITPLQASWSVSPMLESKLHYTGFVAPSPAGPHKDKAGDGRILVSAGGGAVGDKLFETALEAARLTPDLEWHLLVGGGQAEARIANLRALNPVSAIVEPVRPDFRSMLYHTKASVSMCGYNTALDVLQSGSPAVFVPFDDGGETEQTLRARTLAHLDGIEVLSNAELTPGSLADAVRASQKAPRRQPMREGMDGGAETVRILTRLREAMI